jgi:hypothetical protein
MALSAITRPVAIAAALRAGCAGTVALISVALRAVARAPIALGPVALGTRLAGTVAKARAARRTGAALAKSGGRGTLRSVCTGGALFPRGVGATRLSQTLPGARRFGRRRLLNARLGDGAGDRLCRHRSGRRGRAGRRRRGLSHNWSRRCDDARSRGGACRG